MADRLIFENAGGFFDGAPEDYFLGKRTPKRYRNSWLAKAMDKVGMINSMGYGIHNMTEAQRKRYLPLPGYRGTTSTHTTLEVPGRPIDPNYTQLLLEREDLSLDTVIQLDRVQKGLEIDSVVARRLRKEGLIEGRKPHYHVSARIADATDTKATYIRRKGIDKKDLKMVILSHLKRFQHATRPKIDEILRPMLPSLLSDEQKATKVKNLFAEMKTKDKTIVSEGRGPASTYKLQK